MILCFGGNMKLSEVLKYDAKDDQELVWKYPTDSILIGSQLVVGEGRQAIFVKGGQALDIFYPGTHTLTSGNLPILEKLINLPFSGKTPFTAEVWFLNTTVKRDYKWGTPNSIPLMDKSLGFPVSVRAFGKWGVKVFDIHKFFTQIVGTKQLASSADVKRYFIGEVLQSFSKIVGDFVSQGKTSILEISSKFNEISGEISKLIKTEFDKFGVELVNFNIESINIPEDELKKIQEVFSKTLEAKELSKVQVGGAFGTIKTFEVLNKAADNPGDNTIGSLLGAGIGLGAGFPIGQQMSDQMTTKNTNVDKSQDKDTAEARLTKLKKLFSDGLLEKEEYDKKRQEIIEEL